MRILATETTKDVESRKIIFGFSVFAVLVKNVAQPNAVKFPLIIDRLAFIFSRSFILFMANLLFLRV